MSTAGTDSKPILPRDLWLVTCTFLTTVTRVSPKSIVFVHVTFVQSRVFKCPAGVTWKSVYEVANI